MAKNGNIRTTTAFGYVQLAWTLQSQNVTNNTSLINYELSIYRDTGGITSTASKSYSIKINGLTVASGTNTIGGSGTKVLKTGTATIPHNNDGSKSFSLSFSQEIAITWAGSWIGTVTGSGSGTLDTIPRATQPSFYSNTVELGQTLTIYLNRASTSFTHYLEYKIGNLKGEVAYADTVHYWGVPLTLATAIPNAKTGVCTLICHTYNENGVYIGTKSADFTITIPSTMIPTCTLSISEAVEGLNSKFKTYVQSKSKLNVSINASGIYGSTIKSYKTTINGVNYAESSFISNVLANSGQTQITTVVTDSRGMTKQVTTSVNVLPYTAPEIVSFTCERATSSGVANEDGAYLKATINFKISTLNNLNDKSYKLQYRQTGTTTWNTAVQGNVYSYNSTYVSTSDFLNVDNSYEIRLIISDYFVTDEEATFEIGTAFTILDFNASGKGLAIGKVSQQDAFEVAMPTIFSDKPQILNDDNVLWQGNDVMNAGTTITLKKPISSQMLGIVLVFSRYAEGQTMNYHYNSFFVSRKFIELNQGAGMNFFMNTEFIYWANKYLYFKDDIITGHANNVLNKGEQSATGFILNNNSFALRYVIGI